MDSLSRPPARARQPIKALWSLLAVVHVVARTLFLSFFYLFRSNRQHPQWTYRQALTNEFFRTAFRHMTHIRLTFPLSLKPGAEKDRFITIEPEGDVYNGILRSTSIQPAIIGATWYPRLFQPDDERKTVILHFHGGSFLWGTGRISEFDAGASALLKHVPGTALFVQYRLSSDPSVTFPAAVQDAVTAYQFLLKRGVPASNIVVSGDSAGANVLLAFLRYIASPDGNMLPVPSAALFWSPSVDLATQHDPKNVDLHDKNKTDYITGFTLVWGINSYIPKGMKPTDPWFSPLRHPFATKVPLWVMVGEVEVLYDSTIEFANQMRSIDGNRVDLYEVPKAPHDIFFVGHVLGWSKELDTAAQSAAEFLHPEAERQND